METITKPKSRHQRPRAAATTRLNKIRRNWGSFTVQTEELAAPKRKQPQYTKRSHAIANISQVQPEPYHFPIAAMRTHAPLWVIDLLEQNDIPGWPSGTKLLVTKEHELKAGFLYLLDRDGDMRRGIVATKNADGDEGVRHASWYRCFDGMPVETPHWSYMIVGLFHGHCGTRQSDGCKWITCRYGFKLVDGQVTPATAEDWAFDHFHGIEEDDYMFRRLNERMQSNLSWFLDDNGARSSQTWIRKYKLEDLPPVVERYRNREQVPEDAFVIVAPDAGLTYTFSGPDDTFFPHWGMAWVVQRVQESGPYVQEYEPGDLEDGKVYVALGTDELGAFGIVHQDRLYHYRSKESSYLVHPLKHRHGEFPLVSPLYGEMFKVIGYVHSNILGGAEPGEFTLSKSGFTVPHFGMVACDDIASD